MLKYRKETVWYEYIILILPSLLFALLLEFIFKDSNCSDTEYYGDYVSEVTYEEEWDEMVWVRKSRKVPCGTYKGRTQYRTEYYDVRERKYHPAQYYYKTAMANRYSQINKELYEKIIKELKVEPIFIDKHRDYHKIDGDVYVWNFNGNPDNSYSLTTPRTYSNPIKGSRSVFKFEEISKEEAEVLGLYECHNIVDDDQSPIYGLNFGKYHEKKIRWINAYYGPKKQFRLHILFFKNKPESIAEKQRSYWFGGNKNELVCCIGLDRNNKVTWARSFSWEDTPNLAVKSQNWFLTHNLNLAEFSNYITPLIEKEWKRKEFKDFSYLSIEISDSQYIVILILILIYNVGVSIWIVRNEYRNSD